MGKWRQSTSIVLFQKISIPLPWQVFWFEIPPPPHPSGNFSLASYFPCFWTPLPLAISSGLPWGWVWIFLELHTLFDEKRAPSLSILWMRTKYLIEELPSQEVSSKSFDLLSSILLAADVTNQVCDVQREAHDNNQLKHNWQNVLYCIILTVSPLLPPIKPLSKISTPNLGCKKSFW